MYHKTILTFIITMLFFGLATAQEAYHYVLNDENGLPSNTIYDIMQDRKGYMWLGTAKGLVRYNGRGFKPYAAPAYARSRAASHLHEDSKGRVWCQNFSGQVFFVSGDSLALLPNIDRYAKGTNGTFTLDAQDNMYFVNGRNYAFRLRLPTLRLERLGNNTTQKTQITALPDGAVIYNDIDRGCVRYQKGKETLLNTTPDGASLLSKANRFDFPELDYSPASGKAYIYNKTAVGSLYYYDNYYNKNKSAEHLVEHLIAHSANSILRQRKIIITHIFEPDTNNLFISSFNGLLWLKRTADGYREHRYWFTNEGISKVVRDREGNYWVSTLNNGVYIVPNLDMQWWNERSTRLANTAFTHLAHLDNTLFAVNGSGAVLRLDATQNLTQDLMQNVMQNVTQNLTQTYQLPLEKGINTLLADSATHSIWLSQQNLVQLRDGKTAVNIGQYAAAQYQRDLHIDARRNMYSAASDGIHFFPLSAAVGASVFPFTTTWQQKYKVTTDNFWQLPFFTIAPSEQMRAVYTDERAERVWCGGTKNLFFVDTRTNKSVDITINKKPLIANDIIGGDAAGLVYVSIMNQGVVALRDTQIVAHYTTKNGLLTNNIHKLLYHKSSRRLYFVCDKGVQCLHLDTKKIERVSREDGLPTDEINDIDIVNNTLYLATPKGLLALPLTAKLTNTQTPSIYIAKIGINGRDTLATTRFVLPYTQNDVSITFEGLALRARGNFTYRYKMIGLSENGIDVPTLTESKNDFARYSSLPAGSYTFEVVAINEDGIESEKATVSIEIQPLWWRTPLSNFLFITMIMSGLSIFFIYRISEIKKQNSLELQNSKVERELRESELTALKVQMNPHFIFNALNAIQEYILLNEKKLANAYLGKFADLMRYTLDMSQQNAVPLADELRALRLYLDLEGLRFEADFEYKITMTEAVQPLDTYIPSMLLQPYIENAIKHGLLHRAHHKLLTIDFDTSANKMLCCTVTDNGIGRKKAAEIKASRWRSETDNHHSFSTSATQKRLNLLNYGKNASIVVEYTDLYDENDAAAGTKVVIKIPMLKTDLKT